MAADYPALGGTTLKQAGSFGFARPGADRSADVEHP